MVIVFNPSLEAVAEMVAAARAAGVTRFVQVSSPSVAHAGEPLVGVGATAADPASRYATVAELAAEDRVGLVDHGQCLS